MKILYVSPEHISGTLTTLRDAHTQLGDECRFLTFFPNHFGFLEDIALNLPMASTGGIYATLKELRRRILNRPLDPEKPTPDGYPPEWKADSFFTGLVMKYRERVWEPLITQARVNYQLDDYDVYQFEMGVEFFRDGRWVRELADKGKGIIAFYHGTDIRNRGVIKPIDDACNLRLTSELDLLSLHPRLDYLYLPFDTSIVKVVPFVKNPQVFRIGHAARNRRLKGTEAVISAVKSLVRKGYPVELVLIEKKTHVEAMRLKATCHIAIDQLTDKGGWGYGMSSLEFLAMGIPVITRMCDRYRYFLPNHPFEIADESDVEQALERLMTDSDLRYRYSRMGRAFVEKYHDIRVVMRQYYDYLLREKMVKEIPVALRSIQPPPVRR